MAVSTIKNNSFGEWENVTIPFTAPSDGFFYVRGRPSTSTTGQVSITNNTSEAHVYVVCIAGINASNIAPVKKGDVLSLNYLSSNVTPNYKFLPL